MKKKANPKATTTRSKAISKATAVSPVEASFDEIVELIRAARRTLSPALIAKYQTRLPDKELLAAKLHEFYALNALEQARAKPASRPEKRTKKVSKTGSKK